MFVGGVYWGLALSIVNVVLSLVWLHNQLVVVCSILLGLAYFLLIVAGKGLVTQHGEAFATQLLTRYVADDKD